MTAGNDTRGWILTCISGIACFVGASVVCVDLVIRCLTRYKDFDIKNSNAFLSCSLSLSAGVMLFSSLYSMLPSSKTYLQDGGMSAKAASWVLIACFLGGVFGIMILSRVIHRLMPSHAVDCHHTHDAEEDDESAAKHPHPDYHANEQTPLLTRSNTTSEGTRTPDTTERGRAAALRKRPSLHQKVTGVVADLVVGRKAACDGDGPCLGYSEPCGVDCFKNVLVRKGARISFTSLGQARPDITISVPRPSDEERSPADHARATPARRLSLQSAQSQAEANGTAAATASGKPAPAPPSSSHHHHVPTNAFLSISLQTSIAIALHKLPEGFITYATNHANPKLGFAVFVALFIHNISEGFALALPIFLATGSRGRALAYSLLLGGLSQPLGAGVAAAWLAIAERNRGDGEVHAGVGEGIYGGMFAVTSGIMACVALSLFREGLELSHNKGMGLVCVFLGMGILGVSGALTA